MIWVRRAVRPAVLVAVVWWAALGCEPMTRHGSKTAPASSSATKASEARGMLSAADLKLLFPEAPRPVAALGSLAFRIGAERGGVALDNSGALWVGDEEGRLVVLGASRGVTVGALKVHDQAIERVAVGPQGPVVVADQEGDLSVVAPGAKGVVDGSIRKLPARHTKEVTALSISPNGRRLVSADKNGNAFVWDLQAGTVLHTLSEEEQTGDGVVVSRGLDKSYRFIDNRRFVGFGYGGFTLWSADTGKPIGGRRPIEAALTNLVPRGDGSFVVLHALRLKQYAGEPDVVAKVGRYDETGKRLSQIELSVGDPSAGALSPDGKLLVTIDEQNLKIWDLGAKTLKHEVSSPLGDAQPEWLAFSPNSKWVAVVGDGGQANVVDTVGGQAALRGDPIALEYVHYGQLSAQGLAVVSDRHQTHFFDVGAARDEGRFALPADGFRFSADGKSLVGMGKTLWRMDLKTRGLLYERAGPENGDVGDGLAATADLGLVAFARSGTITVLDGAKGTVRQTIDTKAGEISSLALSPDGKQVAAAVHGGAAIWQLGDGRKLRDVELAESSDHRLLGWVGGRLVITGEQQGKKVLWLVDPATGKVDQRFEVGDLSAASPDGKWLVSAEGRDLVLIEVATAKRWRASGPTAIRSVGFSDDGDQLWVGRHGIAEAWQAADIKTHGAVSLPRDDSGPKVQLPPPMAARKDRYGDSLPPYALTRLGTVRGRFSRDVDRLRLRADGQTAWVINDGGRVALWDLNSGKPRREISFSGIYDVMVSGDEKRILSLSYDTLELRDTVSGEVLDKARLPDDEQHLAVTPDFKLAVTGNHKSGLVTLWDMAPLKKRGQISGLGKGVRGLAITEDGRHLAAMYRGAVRLFAVSRPGKPKHEIGGFDEYSPDVVAFSPNGKRLYIGDGETVQVVAVATGKTQSKWAVSVGVRRIALSRDGRRMAFGGSSKKLSVIDTGTGKEILTVDTPTEIDAAGLSKDGRRVVVGTRDDQVVLYDVASGKALHTRPTHYDSINSALFTTSGAVVAADGAGFLQRWKLSDGAFLGRRRIYDYHASFFPMPGGKLLTTTGTFQILDPVTLTTVRQLAPYAHGAVGGVTADESRVVLRDGREAALWDLAAGKEVKRWSPHGNFYTDGATISPDGKHILTGGTDGILKIWSPALTERQAIRGDGPVKKILALADGTAVFRTGSVFIRIDLPSGRERWRSDSQHSTRDEFLFSRDQRRLITTDGEGIVFLDMATGKRVARLPVADWRAGSVLALSPNGKQVMTTHDRMMLIWDIGWVK